MTDCECNSNVSFAISMGFLSLVITLWAIFGINNSHSNGLSDFIGSISNQLASSNNYYLQHPFELLNNPAFYFVTGLFITLIFSKYGWVIFDIIDFFRKEKPSEIQSNRSDKQ